MKKIIHFPLLILIIGCSSPQESLNKRDFDRAYKTALKQLEKGKAVKKNKETLFSAMEGIMDEQLREKDRLVQTNQLEKLEQALKINQNLQEKIDKALTYLDDSFQEDLNNLRQEESELTAVIAKTYFEDGETKLNDAIASNDKLMSRNAYRDLLKAKKYGYDGRVVEPLLVKSREFSVLRYAVEANASFDIEYGWEIDRTFDNLESYNDPFVQVLFENINNPNDIDCRIEINLKSLDIDRRERNNERNFKEKVVVGKETLTNNNGETYEVDKIEEVEGTVIERTLIKTAEWRVNIYVRSNSKNCTIDDTYFTEGISSEIATYVLQGDERAIPSRFKSQSRDQLMSDDDMAEELLKIIYDKVADYIFD